MKKLWMTGVCMLLALSAAEANTRFGIGTITAVDLTGEQSRNKQPSFTVCYETYNLAPKDVLKMASIPIHAVTRHGIAVYLLDGKAATPEEALKVGRAVCMSDNEMVYHVSSQPGPQVPGAVGTADNGVYRIDLGAFQATMARWDQGKVVTDYTPTTWSVRLLVDCREGKVAGAAAVMGNLYNSDYLLDASTLRLQDGRLTGEIAFTAVFTDLDRSVTRDMQPVPLKFTLDVAADEKANVKGTFNGTSGGADVSGSATGSVIARTADGGAHRIWLYCDDFGVGSHGYLVLPAAGGVVQDGTVLYAKGNRIGTAVSKGAKLSDDKLQGEIELTIGEAVQKMTLDGVVLGNRFIFGTWTASDGVKRSFRGGLLPPTGPQIEGATKEQLEVIHSMQETLEQQKSQP